MVDKGMSFLMQTKLKLTHLRKGLWVSRAGKWQKQSPGETVLSLAQEERSRLKWDNGGLWGKKESTV